MPWKALQGASLLQVKLRFPERTNNLVTDISNGLAPEPLFLPKDLCIFGFVFLNCIKMKEDYIHRTIEETILEAYKYFSVISLTGPRQSGKSTLAKHLFPQLAMYSLKNLQVRQFAENDPIAFLSQHPEGMFIDEVQRVPFLMDYSEASHCLKPMCFLMPVR